MGKEKSIPDEIEVIYSDGSTGIEDETTSDPEVITHPFDPTLIRVENKPMSIDLLISRMKEDEINLTPGFQRKGGIWTDEVKSKLIESILIRIPLPAFYMDATEENNWLIIDGLQRLTTIKRFVILKDLSLCGLEFLTDLNNKTFDQLSRKFQRRILETQVTVYLTQEGTPPEVKYNIFKRINTGGLPLSQQEIRHALYQGQVTNFLESLANSKEFKTAIDNGIRDKRMADRECILRYLAFLLTSYHDYPGRGLDDFLNNTMIKLNSMSKSKLNDLTSVFKRTMNAAYEIFGKSAFRKSCGLTYYRSPINKSLFECISVCLSNLDDQQLDKLINNKEKVVSKFIELMPNYDFESAISQSTGNTKKVKKRFEETEKIIKESLS